MRLCEKSGQIIDSLVPRVPLIPLVPLVPLVSLMEYYNLISEFKYLQNLVRWCVCAARSFYWLVQRSRAR